MKEYEVLYDTSCKNLVVEINRWAKEGWQVKSIGGLGVPTKLTAVVALMAREVKELIKK